MDNDVIEFNIFRISDLKEYILIKKKNKFSINDSNDMNLWKVNLSKDRLEGVFTEEDIEKKLNEKKMGAENFFY